MCEEILRPGCKEILRRFPYSTTVSIFNFDGYRVHVFKSSIFNFDGYKVHVFKSSGIAST